MQGHFWHLFLTQFFVLFHMVPLILLSIVAFQPFSENGVKSEPAFCMGPSIGKTNSGARKINSS